MLNVFHQNHKYHLQHKTLLVSDNRVDSSPRFLQEILHIPHFHYNVLLHNNLLDNYHLSLQNRIHKLHFHKD
jgi:hypothetical protein